jgi:ribosomal protein S18 acetylase RimI-like enzyme
LHSYHGTTKTGLTVLVPFASPHSERQDACVYLATQKAIALLHIWDKPYRWVKFNYAKDGKIIYLESYPGALEAFYGGVSGSIYTCEGKYKRYAKNIVIAHTPVPVLEEDYVPDSLERILEYERQGLIEIRRGDGQVAIYPMQKEHIGFVIYLLNEERVKTALHLEDAPRKQWEKALRKNLRDRDEANFILYRGNRPMGWLKLNGLKGDMAWISMLAVHPAHQGQGAGRFAIRYAEQFAREKGFARMGIHTTQDNTAARTCYEGLGYELTEENGQLTYIKDFGRTT